ncbi:mitochondrial chaperone bcs1, putative [Talaromyces stipitatus ATCC 10500]|uniref:Mitochondrial chaperone bcs1, putative n=1 Tax=Talaromyces stipitatus (strain ATCC 10500 / CBS 375.48 / QM 6759 / NRRL 1006) TaxID=441959 RepID=B8MUI6_TALSN|nr:mitochondrial chaperone bcs1, putative [Talaromyces stipitatus ATCC 10500]EED11654.1 mitochondrial chaperone bcs1, putative [Talaromyces stipitatus ATCC 10500]
MTHLLATHLNVDGSSFLTPVVLLGALAAYIGWKPPNLLAMVENWFMSSIEIQWSDHSFEALESWLGQDKIRKMSTQLRATTGSRLFWTKDKAHVEEEHLLQTEPPRTFSMPRLILTLGKGKHWFWYRWRPIVVVREEKSEILDIRLKLAELSENMTAVYRTQRKSESVAWTRAPGQRMRLPSTVIMNSNSQKKFMDDIHVYLQPKTRAWHNARGLPYRKGYLFHGPPGTGKTSLCIAAAGHFKLKIYILSLNNMTEDDLNSLVSTLPAQCILLLEDVDTQKFANPRTAEAGNIVSTYQRLTLSSLLNAIDGVIATEGRILIMTTNHKDKLDPALIRPGRVDMTVSFEYPNFDSIKRLFLLMYSESSSEEHGVQQSALPHCRQCPQFQSSPPAGDSVITPKDELEILAKRFAGLLPEKTHSQAHILNYLKTYSGEPEDAVTMAAGYFKEEKSVPVVEQSHGSSNPIFPWFL